MTEKIITSESFLQFYTSVEEEFFRGIEKLHQFRTERLFHTLLKNPELLTEELEGITNSTIDEIYELTKATEIILMKNYIYFKQVSRSLIDQEEPKTEEELVEI